MRNLAFYILVLVLFSCQKTDLQKGSCEQAFSYIPEKAIEYDSLKSEAAIALGRLLFFEKALSRDSSISCGTCHKPEFAFADNVAVTAGVEGRLGVRNAPSLTNVKYQPYFFHDGGAKTLEMQIQGPFDNTAEFNLNILEGFERIRNNSKYIELFQVAFGSKPTMYLFTRAIALFENSLISANSKWDKFYYQNDSNALNASELNGWKLFSSERLGCTNCHNGFNFTNYTFQNIGFSHTNTDVGRSRITNDSTDIGKFKVPSLRNLGFTPPYMHNGEIKTLDELIDFYSAVDTTVDGISPSLKKISLSASERLDLIHFLEALNDSSFVACYSTQ